MLPISTILSHSLLYGAVLSALLSAFIVATLLFRPMIWINDAPPDLRAAAGPMSAAGRAQLIEMKCQGARQRA